MKQTPQRPDSTLLALPAPAISAPNPPAPTIAQLVAVARPAVQQRTAPVKSSAPPAQTVATVQPAQAVQQSGVPKPAPAMVATLTPADASAVSRVPVATAIPVAPALTSDGRVVLGTKSTVTFEPLHAVPIPAAGLRLASPAAADSIVVYKRERTLTLYYRGVPVRSYFVALGGKPVGDKERIGDQRTPEGLFYIDAHNPASKYHLGLHISYPDAAHRARAEKLGVEPGNDIMIHGLPDKYSSVGKEHRLDDWTNGCIALSNPEIEEIWRAVPDGTPVQIKP